MGPFLTAARRSALGLLLGLGLTGLRCHSDCDAAEVRLKLPEPYASTFGAFPRASGQGRAVDARSSSGLTDRYTNVAITTYGFSPPNYDDCLRFYSETRGLFYNPSLYPRTFQVSLAQFPDGPVLHVQEQFSQANATASNSTVEYPLTGTTPGRVQYYDPGTYATLTYGVAPDAQQLPSLTVAGRTYADVLRLTNPYTARQGPAAGATVYYVSLEYGLLRFEQRDGTVWDLTP